MQNGIYYISYSKHSVLSIRKYSSYHTDMNDFLKTVLSFWLPVKKEIIKSPINKKIIVRKNPGNMEIRVGGYIQSGKYAENLVNLLLSKQQLNNKGVKRILMLGVGGGSMIKVLRNKFPKTKIVGVEIDKEMIKVGEKYFGLNKIDDCNIIIQDAYEYVKSRIIEKFDLIVMDLFIGCDIPKSAEKISFIINIERLLTKNGIFCINRSYLDNYKKGTDDFVRNLKKVFISVQTYYSKPNLLVIAEKQKYI